MVFLTPELFDRLGRWIDSKYTTSDEVMCFLFKDAKVYGYTLKEYEEEYRKQAGLGRELVHEDDSIKF
jgi:hypothetical protein